MIKVLDGQIVISSVNEIITDYFLGYVTNFNELSRTKFDGSKQYASAYASAQRDHQNGVIFQQSLQRSVDAISEINEAIRRPATLHSVTHERFAQAGYVATIRPAEQANKGILAICVDYVSTPEDDEKIGQLIAGEIHPAGQHIEGAISYTVPLSNGQDFTAKWSAPNESNVDFKITITVDPNSQYAVDSVDVIVDRFLSNFDELNNLGDDIAPELYYQITRDAPYASKIETTYDLNATGTYTDDIYHANFDDKFIPNLDPVNVVIVT